MQNRNIYPILATWKVRKDGTVPIYLAIDVDNKRTATKSLKRTIDVSGWDEGKRQVRPEVPNASLINALIQKERTAIDADLLRKELLGLNLTREAVRKVAKGLDTGSDFYAFCRAQLKNEDGEDNSGYAPSTIRIYGAEISKMEQCSPVLSFRDIDTDFIRRYTDWMKHKRKNKDNTIWKSLKFVRTMLNAAVAARIYIEHNPMDECEGVSYSEGIPDYLEWADVQKLHAKIIDNPGIPPGAKKVGYCFLLSCYSGLRFGDVAGSGHDRLIIPSPAGRRLLVCTKKTGEIVSIPITTEIASVLDWLVENPISISNQKYNEHLRYLSGVAEVPRLHSHMGRHSFGMRCAELGMDIHDVREIMGHSKIEQTKRYFRIKGPRLDKAMEAWAIKKPA